jgi:hypothetical protein
MQNEIMLFSSCKHDSLARRSTCVAEAANSAASRCYCACTCRLLSIPFPTKFRGNNYVQGAHCKGRAHLLAKKQCCCAGHTPCMMLRSPPPGLRRRKRVDPRSYNYALRCLTNTCREAKAGMFLLPCTQHPYSFVFILLLPSTVSCCRG